MLALFVSAMVLIARRHDDPLATRREQLTLELAILSEQKSAKIIALLEQFRRNDPDQSSLPDEVAKALSEPADPNLVLALERKCLGFRTPARAREKTQKSPLGKVKIFLERHITYWCHRRSKPFCRRTSAAHSGAHRSRRYRFRTGGLEQ